MANRLKQILPEWNLLQRPYGLVDRTKQALLYPALIKGAERDSIKGMTRDDQRAHVRRRAGQGR